MNTTFTRFENQYIFMLASRAKRDLIKDKADGQSLVDPNIDSYIMSLENICKKASENMNEHDQREKEQK